MVWPLILTIGGLALLLPAWIGSWRLLFMNWTPIMIGMGVIAALNFMRR